MKECVRTPPRPYLCTLKFFFLLTSWQREVMHPVQVTRWCPYRRYIMSSEDVLVEKISSEADVRWCPEGWCNDPLGKVMWGDVPGGMVNEKSERHIITWWCNDPRKGSPGDVTTLGKVMCRSIFSLTIPPPGTSPHITFPRGSLHHPSGRWCEMKARGWSTKKVNDT